MLGLSTCAISPIKFAALALCVFTAGCRFFPEPCFDLAPESRLPDWFPIPAGTSRDGVTVNMCYYIPLASGRTATFAMRDAGEGKKELAEVSGALRGPYPLHVPNFPAERPPDYTSYEVITVGDLTEVIEHRRMEPIFYVVDDPAVRHAFWSCSSQSRCGAASLRRR